MNDDAAIIEPKNNEPVSPINIFAGYRLKKRKPTDIPIIAEDITPTSVFRAAEIYISEIPIEKATEVASPSIPSVKFAQFVIPRRIRIEIG